jgi:2-keto-4-pentenoate hydratase/2-oxohepta-3-ene-1,7-dioic acid hydratase in catechol pathway
MEASSMKLVTFRARGRTGLGLVGQDDRTVHDLRAVVGELSLVDVIEDWARLRGQIEQRAAELPVVPDAELGAPMPQPRRNLWCVGKNYAEHANEFSRSGYDGSDQGGQAKPIIFSKATTSVTGPFDVIDPHPAVTSELDYEAELAVIIGTGGRVIPAEAAFDHVWGYTIVDDVTARDVQRDHKQWLLGKSLDTHCPMGPWAVTADEVGDITDLEVQSWVNGELRQKAPVGDLIFDVPELIRTISAGITLLPGDIIATGTPAGVGIGFTPPRFLASGDVVEVSITGLGAQRNIVG